MHFFRVRGNIKFQKIFIWRALVPPTILPKYIQIGSENCSFFCRKTENPIGHNAVTGKVEHGVVWLNSSTLGVFGVGCTALESTSGDRKYRLRPNRKWKYGGNLTDELAAIDFLFDLNTMYGSIGHRFDARNYFRFRRNRKYSNLTSVNIGNDSSCLLYTSDAADE